MRKVALRVTLALAAVVAACAIVAFVRVAPIDVSGLSRKAPERSALMKQREREAKRAKRAYHESRRWVSLERISPRLREAVLVAEDARFFAHEGFDWNEIRTSAEKNWKAKRVVRGGSTITQQLAKNLWLSTSQSPWRKFEEMILAARLEQSLSKRRILELYLNTIEWGPGVYGAEAAARHWFGTSAGALNPAQAIRLAAVIINPRRYSPVDPNRRILNRIRTIARRLRSRGALSETEYRVVLGLPPEAPAPPVDTVRYGPQPESIGPAATDDSPPPPDSAAGPPPEPVPAPVDTFGSVSDPSRPSR
jgi:monofunctional biosynthetic peptidoglycan transglycosylase